MLVLRFWLGTSSDGYKIIFKRKNKKILKNKQMVN